jgi:hypothetical protein
MFLYANYALFNKVTVAGKFKFFRLTRLGDRIKLLLVIIQVRVLYTVEGLTGQGKKDKKKDKEKDTIPSQLITSLNFLDRHNISKIL